MATLIFANSEGLLWQQLAHPRSSTMCFGKSWCAGCFVRHSRSPNSRYGRMLNADPGKVSSRAKKPASETCASFLCFAIFANVKISRVIMIAVGTIIVVAVVIVTCKGVACLSLAHSVQGTIMPRFRCRPCLHSQPVCWMSLLESWALAIV